MTHILLLRPPNMNVIAHKDFLNPENLHPATKDLWVADTTGGIDICILILMIKESLVWLKMHLPMYIRIRSSATPNIILWKKCMAVLIFG